MFHASAANNKNTAAATAAVVVMATAVIIRNRTNVDKSTTVQVPGDVEF